MATKTCFSDTSSLCPIPATSNISLFKTISHSVASIHIGLHQINSLHFSSQGTNAAFKINAQSTFAQKKTVSNIFHLCAVITTLKQCLYISHIHIILSPPFTASIFVRRYINHHPLVYSLDHHRHHHQNHHPNQDHPCFQTKIRQLPMCPPQLEGISRQNHSWCYLIGTALYQ